MTSFCPTKYKIAMCLALNCGAGNALGRDDISRDLKEVLSDLNVLRDNLQGMAKVSRETGLGKQTTEAELAFVHANDALNRGQWLTVIQESQRYLTLSQKPDPQTWMRAQFILGRAYEERSQSSRAARAYLRYLSAFITSKKTAYNEMGEVLERLVRVATKSGGRTKVELNQFLSSLAALDLPEEIVPELQYFVAVGGANIGQRNLALSWLNDLSATGPRPEQRARALNFKALLAMQDSKWSEAEEILQSLIAMPDLKGSSRDGARLSLARVYLRLKKPNTALDIYSSFGHDSGVYREALFEKTFVFIRQNKGPLARTSASEYLERYPEHPDALQMRAIRSWLDIHAGDLTAAKKTIEGTATELQGIRGEVQSILTAKEVLTHADAKKLAALTNGLVTSSGELEATLGMFEQMADLDGRLEEVNALVLNVLYAVAKSDLEQYKPALGSRISQINEAISQHMELCERHIGIETSRLTRSLTDVDRQKLASASRRRKGLLGQAAILARESKRLVTWLGPTEQLASLAEVWTRLDRISADAGPGDKTAPLSAIDARKTSLRSELLKTLTAVRREQANHLVEQSSLTTLRLMFQAFSASVHDDETILASYEPNESQTLDILDDTDSQAAWVNVRTNSRLIHSAISDLEHDAKKDLSGVLSSVDSLLKTKEQLMSSVADIRGVLERKAGTASATILAHYDSVLGQRIARQQKWAGDIDYLTYAEKSSSHSKDRKAYELELQVLSDNLWEAEQGGPKKWKR